MFNSFTSKVAKINKVYLEDVKTSNTLLNKKYIANRDKEIVIKDSYGGLKLIDKEVYETMANDLKNDSTRKLLYDKESNIRNISDAEIMRVITEEKTFPVEFTSKVKLSRLISYYNKMWNYEFTDDEVDTNDGVEGDVN